MRSSRRALLLAVGAVALRAAPVAAAELTFCYPLARPDRSPGDGFVIRVGYACENLPEFPGWWHTGENWHAVEGDTSGAEVRAVAAGTVEFAGYDYPGPVVIVRHAADLRSVYGHLDPALDVATGDLVARGQRIGTVLRWPGDPGRSHLHFEVRTFLTRDDVNGDAPRYGVHCGHDCPPGPGYWPMGAPEHPSDLGYRNPTHTLARRAFPGGRVSEGAAVVVPEGMAESVAVLPVPDPSAAPTGALALAPGDRHPLLAVGAGPEDGRGTSAEAYALWYRLTLPGGGEGWVQAALPSALEVGSDGRPSAVRLALVPAAA